MLVGAVVAHRGLYLFTRISRFVRTNPTITASADKQRNVVERFLNRLTNRRDIASRYDKLATVVHGSVIIAVIIAAIIDWL